MVVALHCLAYFIGPIPHSMEKRLVPLRTCHAFRRYDYIDIGLGSPVIIKLSMLVQVGI